MDYTWVVMGEASRLPVAAFQRRYKMIQWLKLRRGVSTLRAFRVNYDWQLQRFVRVELDIPELIGEETK